VDFAVARVNGAANSGDSWKFMQRQSNHHHEHTDIKCRKMSPSFKFANPMTVLYVFQLSL